MQEEVVRKEMKLTLEGANLKVKPIIIRQASMWADSFIAREETNLEEINPNRGTWCQEVLIPAMLYPKER